MTKFITLAVAAFLSVCSTLAVAGDLQSVTLDVKGMTCASCPITVKQVFEKVSGVADVSVDLNAKTASVKFDPDRTKPELMAKAVTNFGFPTSVKK